MASKKQFSSQGRFGGTVSDKKDDMSSKALQTKKAKPQITKKKSQQ
jgi:hypothetical protein